MNAKLSTTHIYEIFNSIQGEGPYVGMRQVFVRFCGCNLACEYCDTSESRKDVVSNCSVEKVPGSRIFSEIENPMTLGQIADTISGLWTASTKHMSITGGEPLLHVDTIHGLHELLDKPIYLETNATLPYNARKVCDVVNIASCDIKLQEHFPDADYKELLKLELETIKVFSDADRDIDVFAKIVVLGNTTPESVRPALEGLSKLDVPLVIQPVTPTGFIKAPMAKDIIDLMDFAAEYVDEVRAIPQTHKMMGQL